MPGTCPTRSRSTAAWTGPASGTGPYRIAGFDPANWVGVPGSRAFLFQYGRHDDGVKRAEARELYELAAGPKTWREYDCGHGVDGHLPAREDDAQDCAMQSIHLMPPNRIRNLEGFVESA